MEPERLLVFDLIWRRGVNQESFKFNMDLTSHRMKVLQCLGRVTAGHTERLVLWPFIEVVTHQDLFHVVLHYWWCCGFLAFIMALRPFKMWNWSISQIIPSASGVLSKLNWCIWRLCCPGITYLFWAELIVWVPAEGEANKAPSTAFE